MKAPALDAAFAEARKCPLTDALLDRDERETVVNLDFSDIVAEETEFLASLDVLRTKYTQYREMPLAFATHPMIRLKIRRIVSWHGGQR